MITPGLCSVTLRAATIDEIAALADECGLRAIEWGADVHVPPGDEAAIRRARAASGDRRLSYGSYLLAAGIDAAPDALRVEVDAVLDTAAALGADCVRVWCPFGIEPGSAMTGAVVDRLADVAARAGERDLDVAVEFHGGTLTATAESAAATVDAVNAALAGRANLATYWQPPYWIPDRAESADTDDLIALGARISHVHVYEWTSAPTVERLALADGRDRWRARVAAIEAAAPRADRRALLEFVRDDDIDQLRADARTLLAVLESVT
jgi:sugar phosphate isomerase/epimerase